jgi:hypothetical protein
MSGYGQSIRAGRIRTINLNNPLNGCRALLHDVAWLKPVKDVEGKGWPSNHDRPPLRASKPEMMSKSSSVMGVITGLIVDFVIHRLQRRGEVLTVGLSFLLLCGETAFSLRSAR